MANSTIASANRVQQWTKKFFREYNREHKFSDHMGTNENAVIQVIEDLSKSPGDRITVPLVRRLVNDGIIGDQSVEGNEENLVNYGHQVTVNAIANGVRWPKMERMKSSIDVLEASRQSLKAWIMKNGESTVIDAMFSPVVDGKTKYADATETQKDTWLGFNTDRVLFGASLSNTESDDDHSDSLAAIDGTTDVLDRGIVSLAKRLAKRADPRITPIRIEDGSEWFILYCQSYAFRDLKADMASTLSAGWERGKDNPIFKDGDIIYDGVICREIEAIETLVDVGDSGTVDVAPNFLCGAQAIGWAWAQRSKFVTKKFDYERQIGVMLDEVRGIEKLMNNSVQNGIVTVYTAGQPDA
jgi:N4-gp56 family major capsid protein